MHALPRVVHVNAAARHAASQCSGGLGPAVRLLQPARTSAPQPVVSGVGLHRQQNTQLPAYGGAQRSSSAASPRAHCQSDRETVRYPPTNAPRTVCGRDQLPGISRSRAGGARASGGMNAQSWCVRAHLHSRAGLGSAGWGRVASSSHLPSCGPPGMQYTILHAPAQKPTDRAPAWQTTTSSRFVVRIKSPRQRRTLNPRLGSSCRPLLNSFPRGPVRCWLR